MICTFQYTRKSTIFGVLKTSGFHDNSVWGYLQYPETDQKTESPKEPRLGTSQTSQYASVQACTKMKEQTLLKTALIVSLSGLLILYLISDNIEIKEKNIEKITLENKDEFVKLTGIVNRVVDTEKVTIMEITQPQQITIVLFKDENKTMPIQEGNEVEVFGKVDEYEGKLEIIADRVRIIR